MLRCLAAVVALLVAMVAPGFAQFSA